MNSSDSSDHASTNHSHEISYAQIDWDDDQQPLSRQFGDVFFSKHDGLAESRYVFVQQNNLSVRWQQWFNNESQSDRYKTDFVIVETGFGSGLNFLATWQQWHECQLAAGQTSHQQLHFISIEKHPLRSEDLKKALQLWPTLANYAQPLINAYGGIACRGAQHFVFDHHVRLTVYFGDVHWALTELLASEHPYHCHSVFNGVDAWFLDGFAPAKNPAMWTDALFKRMAQLSHSATTVATFTAAGVVKRGLQEAGFAVEKIPGYGKKRESLRATFCSTRLEAKNTAQLDDNKNSIATIKTSSHTSPYPVPWSVSPRHQNRSKQCIIIGAGLAGCHTARALAIRGWQVTVLDNHPQPGMGASGNPQGIVYGKLSKDDDALAQFNLAALLFAQQCYEPYWQDPELGNQCGVLHLSNEDNAAQLQQQLLEKFGQHTSLLQFLTAAETNARAGIAANCASVFFPKLGWLNPAKLCIALLQHDNIQFVGNTQVAELTQYAENNNIKAMWEIHGTYNNQPITHVTPNLVIANAHHGKQFAQTAHLPLKTIRGQISSLATPLLPSLKTVVCADAYIAPANSHGTQTLGATFTLHNTNAAVTDDDHQQNIEQLRRALPRLSADFAALDIHKLTGRVGFRCTTVDYLPVVGPAPVFDHYLENFALLRKNANASIPTAGQYWPGLYVNLGHGSRGLAYTPLCAELLAAQMSGAPWPMARSLATGLHPARFIIRDLIRRRL